MDFSRRVISKYAILHDRRKGKTIHDTQKWQGLAYRLLGGTTFYGEIELLNEARYTKGIQTVTETICFSITQSCKEKLLTDVLFLRKLCVFLGEKAFKMTSKYTQNQAFPLENRLAAFIQFSSDQGVYKEKHTEICEYLGVSYRHLLYVLAQFCEEKF